MRQSLDHHFPLITIKFRGSAIYLYGPPRAQVGTIPPGHRLEVCLYENHRRSRKPICDHVDVTKTYSTIGNRDNPVPIFSKGGLRDYEHQVVISPATALVDTAVSYQALQFSHAVYTIEQSTPWLVKEEYWGARKVVLNENHPSLSYWPDKPICSRRFCRGSTGWKSKTYKAKDKLIASWRELTASDEPDQDRWGVETAITGKVVALYGAPKVHVKNTKDLGHICIRVDLGHCEIVDVQHAYLSATYIGRPVLLWRNDELDPSQRTRISVRLVKGLHGKKGVFPFKAIHYHERLWYSSLPLLSVLILCIVTPLVTITNRARNFIQKRWRTLPNAPPPQRTRQSQTPLVSRASFSESNAPPPILDACLSRCPDQRERAVLNPPGDITDGHQEATHIPEFIRSRRTPAPSIPSPKDQNNLGPWPGPM